MVTIRKTFNKMVPFLLMAGISLGALFCKMSPIVGSYSACFSLSDVIMPLSGAFSLWLSLGIALVRSGLTFWHVLSPVKALVYHIPGFAASIAWARPSWVLRIVLPAVCMVLFIVHPIGRYAIPYTFYWLIPMIIHCIAKRSVFTDALASTFVAHAVGSVIWLYVKAIPVVVWWNLLPIVAVERLFNALAMTVVYYAVLSISQYGRCIFTRNTSQIVHVK